MAKGIKVGVIGAGTMGRGIAQVAATAGNHAVLYDTWEATLKESQAYHRKVFERLVEKGKFDQQRAEEIQRHISYENDIKNLAGCDLVIEAIVEDLEIKKKVFQSVESLVSPECVLATNTSSLPVTALASALEEPGRFVGLHFFNPAPVMKLVEIVPAIQTAKETVSRVKNLMNLWSKIPVVAKDTPGFIVNKVARPFYGESLRIYEEGIADFATIDWSVKELGNFRMGPFELMDLIGNDINYTVTETVFQAFYFDSRYRPSFTQQRLIQAGYLGKKTGRGYYDYSGSTNLTEPTKDFHLGGQILDRVLIMLINEAADTLHMNLATKEDIEIAMTKGVNYPKGLLQWADEIGIEACVNRMDNLYHQYHEDRYRCSPILRKMAANNQQFFSGNP